MANNQMSSQCHSENIRILKEKIEDTKLTIKKLTTQLRDCNFILSELREDLMEICDHDWTIDTLIFDISSRSYICKKCGMTK